MVNTLLFLKDEFGTDAAVLHGEGVNQTQEGDKRRNSRVRHQ